MPQLENYYPQENTPDKFPEFLKQMPGIDETPEDFHNDYMNRLKSMENKPDTASDHMNNTIVIDNSSHVTINNSCDTAESEESKSAGDSAQKPTGEGAGESSMDDLPPKTVTDPFSPADPLYNQQQLDDNGLNGAPSGESNRFRQNSSNGRGKNII